MAQSEKDLQFIQLIGVDNTPLAIFMVGPETPDNYQALFEVVQDEAFDEAQYHDDDDYNILDVIVEKMEYMGFHRIFTHEVTTEKL